MTDFVRRLKVLFTAFPTYAQILSVGITAALVEAEPYKDVEYVGVGVKWGGMALAGLTFAWRVVRSVQAVPEDERGLLPPPPAQGDFWSLR